LSFLSRRLLPLVFASTLLGAYACGSDPADPVAQGDSGAGGDDDAFRPVGGNGGTQQGGSAGASGAAGAGAAPSGGGGGSTAGAGGTAAGEAGAGGSIPKTHPPSSDDLDGVSTREQRRLPAHAVSPKPESKNPSNFVNLPGYFEDGWAELKDAPGEPLLQRTIDTAAPPPAGPNAKRLTRFVHLADLQVVDDEGPERYANLDETLWPSARPQDGYLCQMANAAVRTINAAHKKDSVDFVLLGGDNAENGLANELSWVMALFNGQASLECDSGDDNDPVPGPNNDGKDPFFAEGLKMPWKWVSGNHDMLVAGNFAADSYLKGVALGTDSPNGTRDYSAGGAISSGKNVTVADPSRTILSRSGFLDVVRADGDGHGLSQAQVDSGYANYTFDIPNTPLRFIVLDFTAAVGGAEGLLRKSEFESFVKPTLQQAKDEQKWVVLTSHHATGAMTRNAGIPPLPQGDAVKPEDYLALVSTYDNVLFSMVGHAHEHLVKSVGTATGHHWWEVMTSAIADFPHQFRTIEIIDQDNGWVSLRATCVDFAIDDDPVAKEGYLRGVIDYTAGHLPPPRLGETADRNVELWIPKPQ
jgi:3',5'-cyclic AMP phosphodiesterase CpdA